MKKSGAFAPLTYFLLIAITALTFLLCVSLGSVRIPFGDTLRLMLGETVERQAVYEPILKTVRLPRVLCAFLIGAALSLGGASMQGLLRNPLADGSTLGVSSGASLGAVLSIAFGLNLPVFSGLSQTALSIVFAFASLALILTLAYRMDRALSTHTIILIGVIFSMLASALTSLVVAFAGERVKTITFWMMGSMAGAGYQNALTLFVALAVCFAALMLCARALNAFSVGEQNAQSVGVHVRAVKLCVLIAVAVLIGVCVSIGGTIGFVGLIIPHTARLLTGPNHLRLLPASMFLGGIFLMLCDLVCRVAINPLELPIGVVTSLIGAVFFLAIFMRNGRTRLC